MRNRYTDEDPEELNEIIKEKEREIREEKAELRQMIHAMKGIIGVRSGNSGQTCSFCSYPCSLRKYLFTKGLTCNGFTPKDEEPCDS